MTLPSLFSGAFDLPWWGYIVAAVVLALLIKPTVRLMQGVK